jgi:hypothetical protein
MNSSSSNKLIADPLAGEKINQGDYGDYIVTALTGFRGYLIRLSCMTTKVNTTKDLP